MSDTETTITRSDGASARTSSNRANIVLHVGFVLTAVVYVALFARTYVSLIDTWSRTGTFQFCFLIFPIVAVLVFSRRDWLSRVQAEPRPRALWLAAPLGMLWLLGAFADINLAQHIAVVAIWPVLIYVFYGPPVARILAFPMGYVLFAIPFGNFLVAPMQTITAHLAVFALSLANVPVFMAGHLITTPASVWHVASACSGIKFLFASTAFGFLYAWLFYQSRGRRIVFVICSMVVPVLANGLRVFFTILIGETFGLHYATGTDHMVFGWQFFGTVLVLLFLAGWFWQEPAARPPARTDARVDGRSPARALVVTVVALVVIVLPGVWFHVSQFVTARMPVQAAHLPVAAAGLGSGSQAMIADPGMSFGSPELHLSRVYGQGRHAVRVDYLRYASHGATNTDTLLDAGHRLFNPGVWQLTDRRVIAPGSAGAPALVMTRLKARQGDDAWQIASVFCIGKHWTTSAFMLKAWQAFDGLVMRPAPAGLLWVATSDAPGRLVPVAQAAARSIGSGAQ